MPTFTMTQKRGGYEPAEVDAYINSLDQQLKEYERKASAINNAIISAQMASDKMIKQANAETSELIKKAKDEAAEIVQKAKDEADTIIKQANDEKEKIMVEARKYSAAIAENATEEIDRIHSTIAEQKSSLNSLTIEYNTLIEKYLKAIDSNITQKLTSDLDKIDSMVSEWEKNGLPKSQSQASTAKAPAYSAVKPAETVENKPETPKPSPYNTLHSTNNETMNEQPKPVQPKSFIKTGLAGGGLGGIPASSGYGLNRERQSLRPNINLNEAPKAPAPAPSVEPSMNNQPKPAEMPSAEAPVNTGTAKPGIYKVPSEENSAPKPGIYKIPNEENAAPKPGIYKMPNEENAAPKPGIYKVTADNHLYNEHNSSTAGTSAPNMSKPGIYKVTSDDNSNN